MKRFSFLVLALLLCIEAGFAKEGTAIITDGKQMVEVKLGPKQDSDIDLTFAYAARDGQFNKVKRLIKEGVKASNKSFRYAVYNYHFDIADYLLEQGVDINGRDFTDQTTLEAMIRDNKDSGTQVDERVKYLVEKGADLNTLDGNLKTPLMHAFYIPANYDANYAANVEYLIEHKANIHLVDSYGHTALYYAVSVDRTKNTNYYANAIEKMKKAGLSLTEEKLTEIEQSAKEFQEEQKRDEQRRVQREAQEEFKRKYCKFLFCLF